MTQGRESGAVGRCLALSVQTQKNYSGGGHPNPVQQLVVSAYECAISILNSAGSYPAGIENFNAYQLDLFLFKDMGMGGNLAKVIASSKSDWIYLM